MIDMASFLFGWVISWYGLLGLSLLCLYSESTDSHYWSLLFGALLIFAGIKYTGISLSGGEIAVCAVLYLPLGIAWSVYRYKRHIADIVKNISSGASTESKRFDMKRNAPDQMIEAFVAWAFLWPVSFLENFVGDIVNTVRIAISTYFIGIYRRIYQNALDTVVPKSMQE